MFSDGLFACPVEVLPALPRLPFPHRFGRAYSVRVWPGVL